MNEKPIGDGVEAGNCEIRLRGHLDARWAGWFDGLVLTQDSDGSSVLSGPVLDQAALHGLLQKVRDTGLPLLSVRTGAGNPPFDNPSITQGEKL